MTIKEATEKWVDGFNAIPQAVIEKLIAYVVCSGMIRRNKA